jgi:hypothetical protein
VPVNEIFKPGMHHISFDAAAMPTLLLTGDFSLFVTDKDQVILKKSVVDSVLVSRIETGFPYLRGELVFETTFFVDESIDNAVLYFKDRKGSIEVSIDNISKGIVAWNPNTIEIGNLLAGKHMLKLKVIGDGIGILHEGCFDGGCSDILLIG